MDRFTIDRRAFATDLMVITSLWALVGVLLVAIAIEPLFAATPAAC